MDDLERSGLERTLAGLDLAGLDHGERWAARTRRASELAAQLCQVQADLVAFTTELLTSEGWVGDGVRSPEHWLQVHTGLGLTQARELVRVAERAGELGPVTDRMRLGAVTLDQAAVIARHVPADVPVEVVEQVAHLAEAVTTTQLSRVVAHYQFDRTPPAHEEPREKPENRPATLTLSHGPDRFRVVFESTLADGALVEQAIREAKDALFTAVNAEATLADGFREVCTRSLSAVSDPGRREQYRVLIHLDTRDQSWINRRGALPDNLARHLTCDGTINPVWETDGTPVRVGRTRRIVARRTRQLIEDRDRGCCYPGCPATGFLENHHLVHWRDGGPTDPTNLVSLCPHHHRSHHQSQFTISGDPTRPDGLTFTNTWGIPIQRPHPIPTTTTRGEPHIPACPPGTALRPTPPDTTPQHAAPPAPPRPTPHGTTPPRPTPHRTALRGERLDLGAINVDPPPQGTHPRRVVPHPRQ